MNESRPHFQKVEASLSEHKGPFAFFALFLREDAPDRWDLVVAADWIDADPTRGLKTVAKEVSKIVPPHILRCLSSVVPVGTHDPAVQAFALGFPVKHGWQEIRNEVFFGLRMVEGFIVTAQASLQPQAA